MNKKITIKINNIETNIIIKNNFFDKYLKKLIKENKKIFFIINKKLKTIVNNFDETEKLIKIFVNGSEDLKSFNNYLILSVPTINSSDCSIPFTLVPILCQPLPGS